MMLMMMMWRAIKMILIRHNISSVWQVIFSLIILTKKYSQHRAHTGRMIDVTQQLTTSQDIPSGRESMSLSRINHIISCLVTNWKLGNGALANIISMALNRANTEQIIHNPN